MIKAEPKDEKKPEVVKEEKKPWTVQAKKPKKEEEPVVIDLAFDPRHAPWKQEVTPEPAPEKRQEEPTEAEPPSRTYAAFEAERGEYGLIDRGEMDTGETQILLLKVARGTKEPWRVLERIRPGETMTVRRGKGQPPVPLRVRYTTPARYYPPGRKVTSLAVGVDASDWRALGTGAIRI